MVDRPDVERLQRQGPECGQCGGLWIYPACGPSHIAVAAERLASLPAILGEVVAWRKAVRPCAEHNPKDWPESLFYGPEEPCALCYFRDRQAPAPSDAAAAVEAIDMTPATEAWVKRLEEMAAWLDAAPLQGTERDHPEGSRQLTLSDALARLARLYVAHIRGEA